MTQTLARLNPFTPFTEARRAERELRMTELRAREAEFSAAKIFEAGRQSVLAELAATG